MQTAKIRGASDDIVEIEGVKGGDEFYAFNDADGKPCARFSLGGNLKIQAIYDGCWHFALGPMDEDIPIPSWPVRMSLHERGYSILLEIDVPDDVAIFRLD